MPPVPPFTTGTRQPVMLPSFTNLTVIDWDRDAAALQSSQIVAGLTLGDDAVASLGTMKTAGTEGITLGSDVIVAAGTMKQTAAAGFTLGSDVILAGVRIVPTAHSALTLAGDIVRALSGVQPITTAAPALTLASDTMHAAGTAAPSSVTAPALVLAGDVFAIPATAHPVTTATAGTTGHGVRLGDDAVLAIEGRAWASVNHRLGSDLVNAAGDVVMPPADTSVALTLADDVVSSSAASFSPVHVAAAITLADDLVAAPTFADRRGGRWADPFSATEVADAALART